MSTVRQGIKYHKEWDGGGLTKMTADGPCREVNKRVHEPWTPKSKDAKHPKPTCYGPEVLGEIKCIDHVVILNALMALTCK